ncbi:MAG: C40 family peptidase [Eubacterium sp.]|nr:C40 family peptidase [Eubacterium sp.]
MRKWSLVKSKKALATGLTTAVVLTSITIPVVASSDYSLVSITAMVEEYISESPAVDPVAELIGKEEPEVSIQKSSAVVTAAPKAAKTAKETEGKEKNPAAEDESVKDESVKDESVKDVSVDDVSGEEKPSEPVKTEEKPEESAREVKYPQFQDRCLATAGVLNIRAEASADSEVVGKIEKGGIALVEEKGAKWTKIGSGNCEGYASNEYLVFGDEAGAWAERNNIPQYAEVKESGLRVRAEANTESKVLDSLFAYDTCDVISDGNGWTKVRLDDGTVGFVSSDYVEVRFNTPKAKTMAQIEAARKAEEEKARREQEAKEAAEKKSQTTTAKNTTSEKKNQTTTTKNTTSEKKTTASSSSKSTSSAKESTQSKTTEKNTETTTSNSGTNSKLRAEMIAYAKQFLGNPYVYGGTSLTNGTDCSGFTMRIYEHFGYKIPRAGGQRTFGKRISVSEAQPGDLIFYPGHVTMYIGNGQVIHASSAKTGIIISSLSYSGTPEFATNIIDNY